VNIVHDQQKKASDDGPDALARTIEAMERIHAVLSEPAPRLATITGDITMIRLLAAGRQIHFTRGPR
jgi:hypothetical protein